MLFFVFGAAYGHLELCSPQNKLAKFMRPNIKGLTAPGTLVAPGFSPGFGGFLGVAGEMGWHLICSQNELQISAAVSVFPFWCKLFANLPLTWIQAVLAVGSLLLRHRNILPSCHSGLFAVHACVAYGCLVR